MTDCEIYIIYVILCVFEKDAWWWNLTDVFLSKMKIGGIC